MNDLIIKNINEVEPRVFDRDGNIFSVKKIVGGGETDTCAVSFVEIPVGKYAYGYHYHDQSEEVFYIISGQGTLRSFYGEKAVKAGDILCFPTGEKGAHVLSNSSDTEPLVYVDFDVRATKTDIVAFPDTGKMQVRGIHTSVTTDIPKQEK